MFEGFEVLYVEDDPQVRESLVQTLELAGLNVRAFESAEALLAAFVPGQPSVVVSDVRLPGMDGVALLERLLLLDATLPVYPSLCAARPLPGLWRRWFWRRWASLPCPCRPAR